MKLESGRLFDVAAKMVLEDFRFLRQIWTLKLAGFLWSRLSAFAQVLFIEKP
jgi:hypothetical protein